MKDFKDGDILVSDKENAIVMLKGNYNDGSFKSYVIVYTYNIDINPVGFWNPEYVNDWRKARASERRIFENRLNLYKARLQSNIKSIDQIMEKHERNEEIRRGSRRR